MKRVGPPRGALWFCLALAALISSGCGPPSEGVEINGAVTYNSQPLTNAAVTFFPVQGRPATAPLDSAGQYTLELAPGDYQVTITVGANVPPGFKEGDVLPPPEIVLPDHYTSRVHTELSATVADDQSEPINFDLK
ncbi:MAG: carboxypeptidase-like regulatory domain-containing protein [Pirellulales bacterium]